MSYYTEMIDRLDRLENKLDKIIESIPPKCARNDERIGVLEREHRNVKRGIWGVISTSILAVISTLSAYLFQR